jgi:hypothetical protein
VTNIGKSLTARQVAEHLDQLLDLVDDRQQHLWEDLVT